MTGNLHNSSLRTLFAAALLMLSCLCMTANGREMDKRAPADSVGEDFVIAGLLISEPGGALYSRFGHAALHLQCPEHNLDYVFTYEAEDVSKKILRFFGGKLRMGMMALPPELYFEQFREQGRELKEYRLQLPVECKRNMWRLLDNRLMQGMDLPYDYLNRGCANSTLKVIEESIYPLTLDCNWPEEYNQTRREIGHNALSSSKWARCFLHLVCNGEIDRQCSNEDKVIIPAQLLDLLSSARVNDVPVISNEPEIIVEGISYDGNRWPSPLIISIILLLATLTCAVMRVKFMDYALLAIQTILGLITVYLVFFSTLVCTQWSWLIVPFNPLPLVFWKWRRHWALPYAAILIVWAAFMGFWPHLMTDVTYIIVGVCIAISQLAYFLSNKEYEKQ